MAKPRYKTTNWKYYNQALINHGSLTFGIDEKNVQLWRLIKQRNRGRSRLFSDLAVTTALMVKRVFSMPLRDRQGVILSIFKLTQLPLSCPHYSCISKRAKTDNVAFKTKAKGTIQHLAFPIVYQLALSLAWWTQLWFAFGDIIITFTMPFKESSRKINIP